LWRTRLACCQIQKKPSHASRVRHSNRDHDPIFDPIPFRIAPQPGTAPMSTPRPQLNLSQRAAWCHDSAISFLMQQGVENPRVLSLAAGLVDQSSLPVAEVQQAVTELMRDPERGRHVLQYGTSSGAERLRGRLIEHVARQEGTAPDRLGIEQSQIVLTTGSQQLLSLLAEVLIDPGDIVFVAAPTYFVFLSVLHGVGARVISVPADDDGMRMDLLEAELARVEAAGELPRVKLIYLVSWFENPSGISLSAERRQQAVEIARRWSKRQRIFILEDAAYRELRYDGPELPSVWSFDIEHEHVILAQTFSKSFSPGLRVGYGVLPRDLVAPVCDRKGNDDFGSAHFNQHLLATVFDLGLYEPHAEKVRATYRAKRDAMLQAADRYFSHLPGVHWVHPHGGLYVWMTLPDRMDTSFRGPLFDESVHRQQVMYVPGDLCYAGPTGSRPNHQMRLSFGVQDVAGIDDGMQRLARAVERS
jgi:2-aminoadipate transaminase